MPQQQQQVVLCVDIEAFQNLKWSTIGIIVAEYPSGNVLDTFETGCMRQSNTVSADKKAFWDKYPEAYSYNVQLCKNKKVYEEEKRISVFVSKWLKRSPTLYIISDNPAFDVGILQSIYQNNAQRCQTKQHVQQFHQSWYGKGIITNLFVYGQ